MPKVPEYPQSPVPKPVYPHPTVVTAYFKATEAKTKNRVNKTAY